MTDDSLVERLRRLERVAGCDFIGGQDECHTVSAVNPDGPEAADRIERLTAALLKCRELFTEIRMDWSDPRSECREGWAVIDAALQGDKP